MPDMTAPFSYEIAFSRNIGWVTEWEQQILRHKRVAIAGMGGVGGVHLLTLARLGIGAFNISDMDTFELANFNRQVGATVSSLGRAKVDVLAQMARDINPELDLQVFPQGINDANIDAFLKDVDFFVDGFDFFILDIRAKVFARCAELGIPAVTAGPIGMGAPYLIFLPGHMTFEEYFQLQGLPREHQYANFLLGISPTGLHRSYLVDPSRLDLANQKGPSTSMACQLCAGVVGVETLKILLGRGPVYPVPHYHVFDAYRRRYVRGKLPRGNRNFLQQLKLRLGYNMVDKIAKGGVPKVTTPANSLSELEQLLNLARWAPSGDNAQPWRFEPRGEDTVHVHVRVGAGEDVYEYKDAQPTLLSVGCLLETMRIAASAFQRALRWTSQRIDKQNYLLTVQLPKDAHTGKDALFDFLRVRSVDRRRYRLVALSDRQKGILTHCLSEGLQIHWYETPGERWRVALLNAMGSDIRLRIPEAYQVHRRILDWQNSFSATGIPGEAVGLNPLALKMMQWAMTKWSRVDFMNRFLGGTLLPRLELDLIPGLCCAAHFAITREKTTTAKTETEFLLHAGQALQRFWLTATQLGLAMQPNLAPLCFGYYGKHQIPFTGDRGVRRKAENLAQKLSHLQSGHDADTLLFMGRIGVPTSRFSRARSVRKPLQEYLQV